MIEKAIHEIIADAGIADAVSLVALLPAAKITTGVNHGDDLPYCNVSLENNLPEYRSNDSLVRRPTVRFQLWHESHSLGQAISDAIVTLFENKTFTTTELVFKLTRHENSFSIEEPDGTWQFVVDIETKFGAL